MGKAASGVRGACVAWLLIALPAAAQMAPTPPAAAASPPAPADDTTTGEARALFTAATGFANRGDWSQALSAFERSEELRPHALTTYNIGFCERALGRIMRARKMLHKALAENAAHGGAELPDDFAASARTYLAELENRVARAVVRVSPADAAILVDGAPLERGATGGPRPVLWEDTRDPGAGEAAPAATFELELDPGTHVFAASKAGSGDHVLTRTLEAGSEVELTLTLPSPAPPPSALGAQAPVVSSVAPPPAEEGGHGAAPNRVPFYVAVGLGAAGLATGLVSGSIALAQKSKLSADCPTFTCTGAGLTDLSRADTAADVATTGFIVGGVGVATAAVLWWLSARTAPAAARFSLWVGPASGGVSGAF
ncbi:MAG: hypothetical protein ACREJ3_19490 [Polyangiaceae bacterium]